MMSYKYTLLLAFVLFSQLVKAQSNIQTMSANPVFSAEASFLNPSFLKNTRGFQLNLGPLMATNLYVGNNFVSVGNIIDYAQQYGDEQINFAPIHAFMDNLSSVNSIMAHADFTLFHATFRLGKPGKGLHVGLSSRQHIYGNLTINDDFFRLMYQGNKQFAGQTVLLQPELSIISYTDFGIALSKSVKIADLTITPAVRFRYLLGNAAAYTDNTNISFHTAQNGEYIELGGHVDAKIGGMFSLETINESENNIQWQNFFKSIAGGYGFDLGISVDYKNFSFSVASIDNGSIAFKDQSSWTVRSQGSARWEGYDLIAEHENHDLGNNLLKTLPLDTTKKGFNTTIGSKITMNGNIGLIDKKDKKGYTYYIHNVGLSYIQGLNNKYNSSKKPMYAIYYQINMWNRLSAGVNYNRFGNIGDLGMNLGFRLVGFNIGVGTNSLFATMNQNSSRQMSLFATIGVAL